MRPAHIAFLALIGGALAPAVAAAAPMLTVAPTALAFGNQTVGVQSAPQSLSLENSGDAPLTISMIAVTGPYAASGVMTPVVIQPGATQMLSVTFTPTAPSPQAGAVNLVSDGGNVSIMLTGTGIAPNVTAAPNPVAFGSVPIGTSATLQTKLTNSGNNALDITNFEVMGVMGEYEISMAPGLPLTLMPGSSATVELKFTPKAHGQRGATLVVTSNSVNSPKLPVYLVGTGVGPRISAPALDVGTVQVGGSGTGLLKISNTGALDLMVSDIQFQGANGAEFQATQTQFTVAAGSTASVPIKFAPKAGGVRTAQAVVASNDPLTPSLQVAVQGFAAAAKLTVTPQVANFGPVRVGSTGQVKLTLGNTGTAPLTISMADITGDTMLLSLVGASLPLVIAAQGQATLTLAFKPIKIGAAAGTLTLTSDDGATFDVPIAGQGATGKLALSKSTIDFGPQVVQRKSVPRPLVIKNDGGLPLRINALSFSGTGASAFALQVTPPLPLVLQPGQSHSLALTFTPPAMGAAEADLVITSDDVDQPVATVKLMGTGVTTALTASPMTVDFGAVEVPGFASRTVTVTNATGDPITFTPELGGASPGAFRVVGGAVTVPPAESRPVTVQFQAGSVGSFAATLTLRSKDQGVMPVTVALKGEAGARFSISATMLDFGDVGVGQSATRTVLVRNSGDRYLQIVQVAADDSSFSSSGSFPPISPSAAASVDVVFTPLQLGARMATVTITVTTSGQPQTATVMVKGNGVPYTAPPEGCAVGGRRGSAPWGLALLAALALWRLRRRRT